MTALAVAATGRLWLWLVCTVMALATIGGVLWFVYSHGVSAENARWEGKWNKEVASQAAQIAASSEANRTEEQRRQKAANEVANDARKKQAVAIDDAAHADAAGDRLHVAANDLASRASCTTSDPGAAERGKAATRAAMVLSDLLSRADKRAGELARFADASRIAGLACERTYDSIRGSISSGP